METRNPTTSDRIASTLEEHLALQWFTEGQQAQLRSRWAVVPSSPCYLVVARAQLQPTDSQPDKDSGSNQVVLLLDQNAKSDA